MRHAVARTQLRLSDQTSSGAENIRMAPPTVPRITAETNTQPQKGHSVNGAIPSGLESFSAASLLRSSEVPRRGATTAFSRASKLQNEPMRADGEYATIRNMQLDLLHMPRWETLFSIDQGSVFCLGP